MTNDPSDRHDGDAGPVLDPRVGLTSEQVRHRIRRGDVNRAPHATSRSFRSIIRGNTITSFNIVIGTMWLLMFIARAPYQDMLFGIVIVLNALIGIVQETRAKITLDRLSVLNAARPIVIRDGREDEVDPNDVVRDDIVLVRTGDQIIVDGVVRATDGMEVDESLLTGEADPVLKRAGDAMMSGSFVVAGEGAMQATKIGMESYANQLTAEARTFAIAHSELMSSIMRFVRTVTWVLIPLGILLFISQIRSSPDWQQALTGTVAGVVTMVPEGLVLLTSVAMAVAVVRLGQRRALVQQMPAVEVLARVDVVCVDKTGTLTEPGMAFDRLIRLVPDAPLEAALGALGAAEGNPNPTRAALACQFEDPGWQATATVPFSSARKWSSASFAGEGTWILGAPEILLREVGDRRASAARTSALELASVGARVLLLGRGTNSDLEPDASRGPGPLEPVALVAIDQRLRPDAAETVAYFLDQGVSLRVISGDNPATVGAIAAAAGIPGADRPFDATRLPTDHGELDRVMEAYAVFGRVTPDQKRAMVAALQRDGHCVAMTGDGVNDVLALKDADLGIAMGSGSPATRAVAQLVLLDSRFAALPRVVAEGRRVLGNIERVSDLFLTKSFYASLLSLVTVILTLTGIYAVEFVFLPRHLTLITFFTIGTPAFFMALMPNTQRFRPEFFRRVLLFAVPAGATCGISSFATYLLVLRQGHELDAARTAAAITLFIVAWSVLWLVAMPLNTLLLVIVLAMGAGFVTVLVTPWLSRFFALELRLGDDGLAAVGVGLAGAAILIALRRMVGRKHARRPA